MIDPNMATMLCFLTTDAVIDKGCCRRRSASPSSSPSIASPVDGDMSTNDTVLMLANGLAGNKPLTHGTSGVQALPARARSRDPQPRADDRRGRRRRDEIRRGPRQSAPPRYSDARRAAEAVANSSLVKCAWFGGDPNWGRIMDAIGYSGAKMREELVDIYLRRRDRRERRHGEQDALRQAPGNRRGTSASPSPSTSTSARPNTPSTPPI